MKLRDKKELHAKTHVELHKLLKDAQEALAALRLDKVQNKLKNTSSITHKRREIAVLQSIMHGKKEVKNNG
jgi:ribosomal protein L29